MKLAIIGAGFAGLSAAKVLKQFGYDVTVFDKTPDVGGVWSVTRRYPGVTTQNNKGTYAYSDFPMPKSYPEWPSGQQVQEYMADYARTFGLTPCIQLNIEVLSAVLDERAGTWSLTARDVLTGTSSVSVFDYLVVANGIFSEPFIPPYKGVSEFEAAGGRICAASDFHDAEDARGKNVVVVGYGKSSCDVAAELSEVDTAASACVSGGSPVPRLRVGAGRHRSSNDVFN